MQLIRKPLPDEQIARLEGIGLVRLSFEKLWTSGGRELVRLKFNEGVVVQRRSRGVRD